MTPFSDRATLGGQTFAALVRVLLVLCCTASVAYAQDGDPGDFPDAPPPQAQSVRDGNPARFESDPERAAQTAAEDKQPSADAELLADQSGTRPDDAQATSAAQEPNASDEPVGATPEPTWEERLAGAIESDTIDRFYLEELLPAMRAEAAILRAGVGDIELFFRPRKVLGEDAPKLSASHSRLAVLYRIRLDALPQLSTALYRRVHGVGAIGRQELAEELGYITLGAQYDVFKIANEREDIALQALERDPVRVIGQILEILLTVLIFRWWRRWVPARIDSGMAYFLKRRPRQRKNLRIAGTLWYFQQVRRPLERLLMYAVIFSALGDSIPSFLKLLWPIAKWILLARFVIQLINAIVKRGGAGMRRDTTGIRLRSLRLIAFWVVATGLGLALAKTLTGVAVLHAWVADMGIAMAFPAVGLLLAWWRPEVAYRLEHQRPRTAFADGILARRKGLESYGATIVGGLYLFGQGLKRWVLRRLAGFEEGRRALATFTHIEAVRLQDRLGDFEDTTPIGETLGKSLVDAKIPPIEGYARSVLDKIVKVVNERRNSAAAIIGERGMGKSFFLQRLADEFEGDVLVVKCPPGGFDAFVLEFARALDLQSPSVDAIRAAIESRDLHFIAVDDAHLLVRPHTGGHADLVKISQFQLDIGTKVPWLYTLEGTTWQYLQRARSKTTIEDEFHILPAWSEEQIAAVIQAKCSALGIDPDYSRLVLPTRFDEVTRVDSSERNRLGMARALWTSAEGNPEVAARLFTRSLVFDDHQRLLVRLYDRLDSKELQRLHLSAKLVLRYLAMSELATSKEIERGLRLGMQVVQSSLVLCEARGYIESKEGRYRLTWTWFRTITQSLSRQNLLARSRARIAQ